MKKELLYSIVLATTTFLLGILLGYSLIGYEIYNLLSEYENLKILVDSAYYTMQEFQKCDIDGLHSLGKKVDMLGYKIEILETSENPMKDIERLKILKSYYFNLLYLHYLLSKNMMEKCNATFNIIIYFYMKDEKCQLCKEQGYQLTHLKKLYTEDVMIYSFDLEYPHYFIYNFKEKYSISSAPFLILINKNGTYIFDKFTKWEEIEKYLVLNKS